MWRKIILLNMSRTKKNTNTIKLTRPPTQEEIRWFDYAAQLPFRSDEYLTRFADKLLGLSTGAIGVYVAIIQLAQKNMTLSRWIPFIFFFVALFSALVSIFPRKVSGNFTKINLIQQHYLNGLGRRRRIIILGLVSYVIGIIFSILALFIG